MGVSPQGGEPTSTSHLRPCDSGAPGSDKETLVGEVRVRAAHELRADHARPRSHVGCVRSADETRRPGYEYRRRGRATAPFGLDRDHDACRSLLDPEAGELPGVGADEAK